jgi:hypothetical protein
MSLSDSITKNVRDALNGDKVACKRLNLLMRLPFASILKLYGTSEEDYYALNFIAMYRAKIFNDKGAIAFLTSEKNPLRKSQIELIGV